VPPVLITEFLVFNQPVIRGPVHAATSVTLEHSASVISLEFAALHFADARRNRYAYQLEGFDKTWVETGADKRFATYTNLDPGTYTFRVKASNKDGLWNEEGAKLTIVITPPFWQTAWFRVLLVLSLAAMVYGLMRFRLRALELQKAQLEQQVKSRTLELLEQKDAAERQKESVELAHRNISLLSEIGRKLTANLDSEAIMLMLYEHVNELMDASVFGIGVYRPERGLIEIPFAVEKGKRYEPYTRSMSEPNQLAVWCINHQSEVFINDIDTEYSQYISDLALTTSPESMGTLADGTLPTEPRSMMYVPIVVNHVVRGLLSVHSYKGNAYQRMHLDMLRTLAAYVGVAFENADAYEQLKDTQAQLVAQEKLAALGSLVAGVAHELNTPIGNSLLMASTLQEKTADIGKNFEAGAIKKSDLGSFIGAAKEAASLIMRSLMAAADLVNSFKQVAVDQASAHRRPFELDVAVHEITATMMNQVRKAGHVLETDIPAGIKLHSYPGPFGQVLINFMNNAMLHAFEQPGGTMRLVARLHEPGRVLIEFSDNGRGIPKEHLPRIFDPFFTTKMGQGGSGLGLNIAYNITTSLLEGSIRVDSTPGGGTRFTLDLPLVTEKLEH
jgi:signal transduction histidine kinase